jgi:hypothetical protein
MPFLTLFSASVSALSAFSAVQFSFEIKEPPATSIAGFSRISFSAE